MKKILIANRGEIAVRIVKACKEMGIQTVSVYSEIDKEALHVLLADESYQIGKSLPNESYLNMNNILELAKLTKCDAIHPGYGFLSESMVFRRRCDTEGIQFIGPSSENLKNMGNKLKAKEIAKKIGMPIVPGFDELITNRKELEEAVKNMEFPIILKASSGGGGKGIKVCNSEQEAFDQFSVIVSESEHNFGQKGIYIEKYIPRFRHIEIQIIGDQHGNYVHIGERLCSIQRNMQKLIEESPAPFLPKKIKREMCEMAVKLAKEIDYVGLGTIEYIYDYKKNEYYFMEMNTRIQVEHPVTEMLYDIDLVKEQIRIAMGQRLEITQADIKFNGHAIECRVNAEDYEKKFMPSVGEITMFIPPYGMHNVRIDSYIYTGYKIPPYYDSMLGKVIVHGKSRFDAIKKMEIALETTLIEGVTTTIPFLKKIIQTEKFIEGSYDNLFVSDYLIEN